MNDGQIQRRGASQSATVIIAASDSLRQGRADYVCGGVDDYTIFNSVMRLHAPPPWDDADSLTNWGQYLEYTCDRTIVVGEAPVGLCTQIEAINGEAHPCTEKTFASEDWSAYNRLSVQIKMDHPGTFRMKFCDGSGADVYSSHETIGAVGVWEEYITDLPSGIDWTDVTKIAMIFYPDAANRVAHFDSITLSNTNDSIPLNIVALEGHYDITHAIVPVNGTFLTGLGSGTVFVARNAPGHIMRLRNIQDVTLRNFTVDGAITPTYPYAQIDIDTNCSNVFIDHVDFKNGTGDNNNGLRINNSSWCGAFFCKFDNHKNDSFRVCMTDYCWFSNNQMRNYGRSAMGICCPRHHRIHNNMMVGTNSQIRASIWLGHYHREAYDCDVNGNIINNEEVGGHGIAMLGSGPTTTGNHGDDFRLTNNQINVRGNGIYGTMEGLLSPTEERNIRITGNTIKNANRGIWIKNEGDHIDARIYNNTFVNCTTPIEIDAGAIVDAWRNKGFVTENSGTATLVNGTTSIPVEHGLAVTPTAGDIVVTPIEAWGNMTTFYIDTYTATHFTIHSPINPGQDVDFAWKAIVL